MKNLNNFIGYRLRYPIAYSILIIVTLFLMFWRLSSTSVGLHQLETSQLSSLSNLETIVKNPLNVIYNIAAYFNFKIFGISELGARAVSAVFGVATIGAFFWTLRCLYWRRIAVFGSLLLVSSTWFLHTSRFGAAGISSVLFVTLLIGASTQFLRYRNTQWLYVVGLVVLAGLTVPLFIYVLCAGLLANHKALMRMLKKFKTRTHVYIIAAAILLFILMLAIIDISQGNGCIRELIGAPGQLPTIRQYFSNIQATFGFIFWRSFEMPGLHLGQLPMLDIFTASMTALGLYEFESSWHSERSRFMLFSLLILTLAVSLNPTDTTYPIMMPFIYIIAANGVSTLLGQWYSIFPKNPVARTVALVPIGTLIIIVFSYHTNRYFVAWASAPETRAAFNQTATSITKYNKETSNSLSRALLITTDGNDASAQLLLNNNQIGAIGTSDMVLQARQSNQDIIIDSTVPLEALQKEVLGNSQDTIVIDKINDPQQFYIYRQ